MAETDYAIIVGINRYPELPPELQGAENDATDFYAWLTSPEGGNVPVNNAKLIVSSGTTRKNAQPTIQLIEDAFELLQEIGRQRTPVGRRLYLFFAGHGFSPDDVETAVLMANASQHHTGYHIPGRTYANWFRIAAYFEEVVLFMDCCRKNYRQVGLKLPPWPAEQSPNAGKDVRYFYGFATFWAGKAYEDVCDDGRFHGLFSYTLLSALQDATDENGDITSESVKKYVINALPKTGPSGEEQEPWFDMSSSPIVFGHKAPATFPVFIFTNNTSAGLILRDKEWKKLEGLHFEKRPLGLETRLPRGFYKLTLGGKEGTFDVTGAPGVRYVTL